MKRIIIVVYILWISAILISSSSDPLSGTLRIGLNADYASFTEAINALNTNGVCPPGVVFVIDSGLYQENPPAIMTTGTENAPITFVADNPDSKPILRASGATNSYGLKLVAASYLTFESLSIISGNSLSYGIWLDGGSGNNSIINCDISFVNASSGSRIGIYSQSTTGLPNNNNSFSANTISQAMTGIYVSSPSSSLSENCQIFGNNIQDVYQAGILHGFGTNASIAANAISLHPGSSSTFEGIRLNGSTSSATLQNNSISGGFTSASAYGIYISNGNHLLQNNTIGDLQVNGSAHGIFLQNGGTVSILGNNIRGLSSQGSAATYISGITIEAGQTICVANNMICDLRAPATASIPQIRGLQLGGGTNLGVYYNSIFLDAFPGGSNATFSSAGLYMSSTGGSLNLQNNIIVNMSSPGTGSNARSVAFWKTGTGFANLLAQSNCNIYYAGEPGVKNLICYNGTTGYQSLEDYQLANPGKDQGSYTEDVPFLSVSLPYDLHINPAVPTLAEGNANPFAAITTDFDAEPRDSLRPDIGADEGSFTAFGVGLSQPELCLAACAGGVMISWQEIAGADLYQVFCSPLPDLWEAEPSLVTTETEVFIPGQERMFFRVIAVRD